MGIMSVTQPRLARALAVRRARTTRVGRARRRRAPAAQPRRRSSGPRARRRARPRGGPPGLRAADPADQHAGAPRGRALPATEEFLRRPQPQRTPFVIGIAGSVAVGKSTTARLLRELLAKDDAHSNVVELVTTDGFLLPNAELERRGLLDRKGFPESYDRKALLRFVMEVKSGVEVVEAPVYSHLTYDRTDEVVTLKAARHRHRRGAQRPRARPHPRRRAPGAGDQRLLRLLDLRRRLRQGHPPLVRRALPARCARRRSPIPTRTSTGTARYRRGGGDRAGALLWDTINGPNLKENIEPTRGRASLVLRKDADHSVDWVRLRKL